MSELRLHNTLSGAVESFRPPRAGPVTMYVCGPTVYGEAHVGNARPVVVFDVLYRLLKHLHGNVSYARNITDIDDKIITAAQAKGVSVTEIASKYETIFKSNAQELGNLPPDQEPRATEHIDGMVAMIGQLIGKGHAYVEQAHVLFAVSSFGDYGKLANRNQEEMIAGARVEVAPYKREPGDFVLWKPSDAGQPGWDSPWGRGRPGWHIECSAMIKKCLGETIDIHGGGHDLAFPHHENEIAQSRCALQTPELARYWLHNGHVTFDGHKMAKSKGNFSALGEALASHPGEVIRYALLSTHYRSPLDWGQQVLAMASNALTRLYRALAVGSHKRQEMPQGFVKALCSDLNTPQAFSILHKLAKQASSGAGQEGETARGQLLAAGNFIGLLNRDAKQWSHQPTDASEIDDEAIEELVHQRVAARKQGDYALADKLREQLSVQGVTVEDSGSGTTWRRR